MLNELKRRYINKATLLWMSFLVITILMLTTWFFHAIIRLNDGEGCVMDTVYVLAQSKVFPMLALLCGMWNILMLKCDEDPMIVIKYGNRKRIWIIECKCAGVAALVASTVILLVGFLYASVYFEKINNWGDDDSFTSYLLLNSGYHDYINYISPILIILVTFLIFSLLIYITYIIGTLTWWITGSITIPVLVIASIAVFDAVSVGILYRFNVYITLFSELQKCMVRLGTLVIFAFILTMAGLLICKRKEYKGSEKEKA